MKLALFIACVALFIVGVRLHRSSLRESTAATRVAELQDSLQFVKTERATLIQGLESHSRRQWHGGSVLTGVPINGGARAVYGVDSAEIVYIIEEWCAACLQNLPLLDSLRIEGVRIVGVSHHGSEQSLRLYAARENIKFPVLVESDGPLVSLTDVFITPIAIFMSRGRVSGFRVGKFQREEVQLALQPHRSP